MQITWALGVLPDDGETVVELRTGHEPNAAVACDAVVGALLIEVIASERPERQEYRLGVDGREMIVWPGRGDDGKVDLAGVDEDLQWLVSTGESR